jgi:hypothetical protein
VAALTRHIRDYMTHWNTHAEPLTWTATATAILAKVRLAYTSIRKLAGDSCNRR